MNSPPNKESAAARWVGIVVALLVTHIGLMSWAVVKAVGDPNFQVIPNYYEKAVNWDRDHGIKPPPPATQP